MALLFSISNKYTSWLLLISGLFQYSLLCAQKPLDFAGKYEAHKKVILAEESKVLILVDEEELEITATHHERNYYPGNEYNGNLIDRVGYEPEFSEVTDLDGFTLVPDFSKNKYKKEKISKPDDIKLMSASVFHDGVRAKSFYFEEVKQGAITELNYSRAHFEPHLLGRAVFATGHLLLKKTFTLQYHPRVKIAFQYQNCDARYFQIDSFTTNDGLKTISWTKFEIPAVNFSVMQPGVLNFAPHIIYRIKSYRTENGEEKKVLNSLDDVHRWNNAHLAQANNSFSPELKEITRSLCAQAPTALHKAKNIYNWVCNTITYLAFEDGMGGYQPRDAAAVCTKRYGDCKDMANLMVEMMRYAGLNAAPVWIGTRSLPYKYSEFPTPSVANHMICGLYLDDSIYFLDATNKGLPFGFPSAFTQGKEALIGLNNNAFTLDTVPVIKAGLNIDADSNWVFLENNMLKGTGTNVLTGLNAYEINAMLEGKNLNDLDKSASSIYRKAAPRCRSTLVDFKRIGSQSVVKYEFEIERFGEHVQDFLYLNLNLDQPLKSFTVSDERTVALDLEKCSQINKHLSLKIPEGYEVDFIPENRSVKFPAFTYDIAYEVSATHILYSLTINWNQLTVEPADFAQWNAFVASLNQTYQESIVLRKL